MWSYLKSKMRTAESLTVTIQFQPGWGTLAHALENRGVYDVDGTGIVVEGETGADDPVGVPWSAIRYITIQEG
jgi:hypothetical protein